MSRRGRGRGGGQPSPQRNNTIESENYDSSHAQVAKIEMQGQPAGERSSLSESEFENYDSSHAQVAKFKKQGHLLGKQSRELDSIGNEEKYIPKELQTLAQELGVTDGSPQEIIKKACRKVKELEELKKDLFSVNRVNGKEHDIEKAKAKIQGLHRCQEDLTLIKTAAMNPNKSKGFKLTQSAKEVEERIHTLNDCLGDLTVIKTAVMNSNKSKDFKPTQSAEEVVERIHTLHSCLGDLTVIKTAVMNPNKSKDFKLTQSAEEVVERINTLHGAAEKSKNGIQQKKSELEKMETEIAHLKEQLKHTENKHQTLLKTYQEREQKLQKELKEVKSQKENALTRVEHECLGLKEIVFNKELLKLASFNQLVESQHTVENADKIAAELTRVCKKMETDQKRIYEEVLGKNEQPNMEEVLKAVQSLKKAADESWNEMQQQKTKLEKIEKVIAELKEQLTDAGNKHQALLKRNQEREQKLTDELNEVKSQKEKALTRLSELAGAKLTESNPYITNLNDPNRPEKIGEQFSELYDILWTDVFEKLSGTCKLSERDSIQTLLQILEDSYDYCKDISSKRYLNTLAELTLWKLVEPNETPSQAPKKKGKNTSEKKKDADTKETTVNVTLEELQKLQTLLGSPSSSSPADSEAVDSILAKIGLNVTSLSNIKKMLKSSLEGTSVIVQESFWKQRSEDPNGQKEVLECTKPFLMKCVHICWLMLGQDPPVYLRFSDKSGDKFNKDVYREYTANGKVLDFVVWPAIFLHENGPLLKKGVAQPIAKK